MKVFAFLLASLMAIAGLNPATCNCNDNYDGNNFASGTAGGARFEKEIGLDNALYTLQNSSALFYRIFNQRPPQECKNISLITLNIQPMSGIVTNVDNSVNSEIFMNSNYIGNYSGDIKTEFTGIMYHEIARVRQFTGNGGAPTWLLTGIADFFRLKGGYASAKWVKPGGGIYYEEGYDVAAMFLDYCNNVYFGFIANLNALMKNAYSDEVFQQLTGKTVNELWDEYKANYGFRG